MTTPRRYAAVLALSLALSTAALAADQLALRTLSNRADVVSGGDALVEIVLPAGAHPDEVQVTLAGRDITSAFAVRTDGRLVGLVGGLAPGANDLFARIVTSAGTSARLTITNHPVGGPVFSGAQLQPWICAYPQVTSVPVSVPGTALSANVNSLLSGLDDPPEDAQCNVSRSKLSYFYQPKAKEGSSCFVTNTGSDPCFVAYDTSNPPADADVANFTNDRGDTVKSILVLERGSMDRGIYQLVTFKDPSRPSTVWARQNGWNGKLLWKFGASAAVSRFQTPPGTGVFDDNALRRGFMVASSSLTDHGTNSNDTLGAEMMAMVKEHIVETYGDIRYTIGNGCSGGSIMQHSIAAAYPGLLQGIQPNCSYPDTFTTFIEIADCGVLQDRYYRTTANGGALSLAQRAAINGHNNTGFCNAWITSFLPAANPTRRQNCGANFPAALTYNLTSTPPIPDGVRCTGADHDASMLGTFVDTDGNTKANGPVDNEGVQYGLKTLRDGVISPEEFVRLNEGVGGYTADLGWTGPSLGPGFPAPRQKSLPGTLHTMYSGGLVSDGRQLAKVAMIDLRGDQNPAGDIHMNWRAWAVRSRLDQDFGDHDNQVIWAYTGNGGAGTVGAALTLRSFLTMDAWLANIERDTSDRSLEAKVRANKPAGTGDLCLTNTGALEPLVDVGLGSAACPVKFQASPRQVAGGPLAENVFKCQLKPLDFTSAEHGGVAFTADQQARLAAVFPTGVCDWSRPGVQQVREDGWTTYEAGPGGRPLGDAPATLLDTTPPAVTATLSPSPNAAGWNNTPVTVTWNVADPEMGVASTNGCGPTTLTADTAGTMVTCSATNRAGVPGFASVTVKIDRTPPAISGLPAAGCTLWPPNNKLVQVASPTAADALSQVVTGSLSVQVTSNEPADGDVVVSSGAVQVRAQRLGSGNGRVYTIEASARDAAGNSSTATATCAVPHDKGK